MLYKSRKRVVRRDPQSKRDSAEREREREEGEEAEEAEEAVKATYRQMYS